MTRTRQVLTGLAALLVLLALVAGVPWALVSYIGWPLPHAIPGWQALKVGLTTRGIPTEDLIKALAVVVWAGWAVLTVSIAAEAVEVVSEIRWRRVPLGGATHPFVRFLVTAVVVAMLGALPRPTHSGHLPLAASLATTQEHTPTGAPPLFAAAALAAVRTPAAAAGGHDAAAENSRRYVVQRRDTLWGIAEKQLNDPTRWNEIYALNEGRHQPDGQALTSASLIRPGWTLLLPASQSRASAPAGRPAHHAPAAAHPTTRSPGGTAPAVPSPPPPIASSTPPVTRTRPGGSPPSDRVAATPPNRTASRDSASVILSSGSEIGAAFAAAVLAALAAARLRKRRLYRPAPPSPARYRTDPPLQAPLRDLLRRPGHDGEDDAAAPDHDIQPANPALSSTAPERDAGAADGIEIGTRMGQPVRLPLTGWGGLTLSGAGARDATRAWVVAALAQAGPLGIHIYGTREDLEDLTPGMEVSAAIRVVDDDAALLRCFEQEVLARGRKLAAASIADAASYRRQSPEDPLPLVLAIISASADAGRWRPALQAAMPFGVDALRIAPDSTAAETASEWISVTETGEVHDASAAIGLRVSGARLFRLSRDDAEALLRPIAADHAAGTAAAPAIVEPDPMHSVAPAELGSLIGPKVSATPPALTAAVPAVVGEAHVSEPVQEPAIRVQLLGALRIWAHGEEIATGLRSGARELLAWYLLQPDGATAATAIDAIWPDVTSERGPQRFWNALGNLRSRLRAVEGAPDLEVLVKTADRYRADISSLDVDVWRFQAALNDAAHGPDIATARDALETATATFSGDLLDGEDYPWVEPLREELHRRALDAYLRLAEIQAETDDLDSALESLERAITIDPLAEDAYRRILHLQAGLGRIDGVQRTWALLRGRLADLDLDPEPETVALYRALISRRRDEPIGSSPQSIQQRV